MNYDNILVDAGAQLPCAFVDLEAFDANIRAIAQMVEGTPFTIRVASKSLRVPELISRVLKYGAPFKGLMCYSAQEAFFLSEQGFDDLMVAYPTLSSQDLIALKKVHNQGKLISLVTDDVRQLEVLNHFFEGSKPFPVLIEPDLSLKILSLTVGVRRSPLRSVKDVTDFAQKISTYKNLIFLGIMAYEAQVAGVPDKNPFKPFLSPILGLMRKYSARVIAKKRQEIRLELERLKLVPEIFNGGGTGSLSFNRQEDKVLTEVTAGSGFFCPHLFDYYSNFKLKASAFFALQVVRAPEAHWYTCQGGGYIASGEPSWDRVPKPMDANLKLSNFEATGEVQTPVHSLKDIKLGSPVIFRHAKAGELGERFNEFVLIQNGKVTGSAKTYRGMGQSYF